MYFERTFKPTRRFLQTLALVVLLSFTTQVTLISASPTSSPVLLGYVEITNVRETTLTVSWVTDVPSDGVARCYATDGTLAQTGTDPIADTTTHSVSLTGLAALSTYRCEVESGGVVNNNSGAYYAVTMGSSPTGIPPQGGTNYGLVFWNDGVTQANGSIFYMRLIDVDGQGSPGSSQWASSRVEFGYWFLDPGSIRTADGRQFFEFTREVDQMEIWVQGGIHGTWGHPAGPEAVRPIPPVGPFTEDIVLDGVPLPFPPAAVSLSSFFAVAQSDGIQVNWETASELDNQGFNLYRSEDPAGTQELLAFIPSQAPGSAQGFAYEWLDSDVVSGQTYYYWLESIDLAGAATMHGPVSATYGAPTAVDLAAFTAQPMDNSALLPLLLILLGVAAYGLHHGLRRRITIK